MKKYILILIAFCTFTTSYTQNNEVQQYIEPVKEVANNIVDNVVALDTSSVTNKVYGDISGASSQIYTDVKDAIKAIASGLSTTTEKVWDILIRQQLVYGICGVLFLITSIILIYNGVKLCKKFYSRYNADEADFPGHVFIGLGIIGLIIGNGFAILHTITAFVNPEYGVIKEILTYLNK